MVSFANLVIVDNVKLHSACRRIPRQCKSIHSRSKVWQNSVHLNKAFGPLDSYHLDESKQSGDL